MQVSLIVGVPGSSRDGMHVQEHLHRHLQYLLAFPSQAVVTTGVYMGISLLETAYYLGEIGQKVT